MKLAADGLGRVKEGKRGVVVGDAIAGELGCTVGDRSRLESGFFPGDWAFTIDGVYTPTAKSVNGSNVLIRWDCLNDSFQGARSFKDTVGLIISRVDDPSRAAEIALALD